MRWLIAIILPVLLLVALVEPTLAEELQTDVTVTANPSYPTEVPTVTASNATGISISSATLHGNVTDTGGGDIPQRGFYWGLATGSYAYSWNGTGSFGLGEFEHQVSGLPLDTQIFWIAFAVNGVGQGNSTEQNFWTFGVLLTPTNFTVTQMGLGSVNVTWTMGVGADTTIVRVAEGGYPKTVTDGYLAYSGNGTSFILEGLTLSMVEYYFRAWSESEGEYSEGYAEARIGGETVYVLAFIGVALFFMWLAFRSRQLLVCLTSSFIWLALSLWLFFSDAAIFDLSQGYVQILAYVFFIVGLVPLMWSMDQEIKHEAQGKSWSTYGTPPKDKKVNRAEVYRKNLRRRIR